MIKINVGYIQGVGYLKDDRAYEAKRRELNVDKLFYDRLGDEVALHEMLDYARAGDNVVIEDIRHLGKRIGEFIEIVAILNSKGISVVCKKQQVDTSTMMWSSVLEVLSIFEEDGDKPERGRPIRFIQELDNYFDMVEQKKITVGEVCELLKIGRSTYYRRWRQVKEKPHKERHPELFDEYEEQVRLEKISVAESCRQMNIGITTYYRMRERK